jgi:serine/threonine-protein kinase
MTPERWRQVEELYQAALEREPAQRAVFLSEASSGDEELRREVESLLAQESSRENVLDRPARIGVAGSPGSTTATLLAPGTQLGPYRIEAALGAGGMGQVYKARDTRLGRVVAVKILAERFSDRFEREARAISALNHPHICTLHDVGPNYLVMELVEGETLAARLQKGPLPMALVLRYGGEIADALAAAHSKGITHRDLKPGNIMLTKSGVKVLDFGLAKMTMQPGIPVTPSDAIVGTPAYMAPEQLQGEACDARTDIFALGLVLYEMATGKRGQAAPGQAVAVDGLPAQLAHVVERCLERDPENRWQSARDVQAVLDWTGKSQASAQAPARESSARWAWRVAVLACAGLLALAVGWTAYRSGRANAAPPRVTRFTIEVPDRQSIIPSWNPQVMFSRDAKTLLFAAVSNDPRFPLGTIYRRRLGDLETGVLLKGPTTPVFSPDNRWIMLLDQYAKVTAVKYPLSGGAPVPVLGLRIFSRGDWGSDGFYYCTGDAHGGVSRTPVAGGKPEPVVELNEAKQERVLRHAQLLPGEKALIFTVALGEIESFDDAHIDAFDLRSRKRFTLVEGGTFPRYSPSGHIVYARGGSLYAVPFDADKLEVTGIPQKVLDGVLMSSNSGTAYFDVSSAGDLAYAVGTAEGGERTLHWVDRAGKATRLPLPPRSYLHPRISPDGRQLAIEVEGANHDLYVHDFERGVTTKITTDGLSHGPIWSPDAKYLAFRSWQGPEMMTMWRLPSDRSGPPERLMNVGERQSVGSFSPDGEQLVYEHGDTPGNSVDIWVLPMRGARTPKPLVTTKATEGSAKFSPDGKWVVYCSTESGRAEVYVQPWPGPGPKIQISSDGGTDPVWRRDGKEIFYRNEDKMVAVAVTTGPPFRAGKPVVLWEEPYSHGMSSSCGPPGPTSANYDITADGKRFLMVKDNHRDVRSTKIVVILNWAEELKAPLREASQL